MKTMAPQRIAGFYAVTQNLERLNTKQECWSLSNITEEEQDFSF
jgi:hypothetical protein